MHIKFSRSLEENIKMVVLKNGVARLLTGFNRLSTVPSAERFCTRK
jgi:hypothetical protein